jgi:hypothetical protein
MHIDIKHIKKPGGRGAPSRSAETLAAQGFPPDMTGKTYLLEEERAKFLADFFFCGVFSVLAD